MKTALLDSGSYPTQVMFTANIERSRYIKYVQKKYGIELDIPHGVIGSVTTMQNKTNGSRGLLVWVQRFDGTPETHGTLSHELWHATTQMMRDAGVKLCDDSEEAYAYLFGHLHRQSLRKLEPKPVKKVKKTAKKKNVKKEVRRRK